MIEHHTRDGKLIYFMSRSELEAVQGYHAASGGRKGRAACPIHNGNNPTALSIDWESGWGSCWSCGDAWSIRVSDHPDARLPGTGGGNAPRTFVNGSPRRSTPKPDLRVLKQPPATIPDALGQLLQKAIDGAAGQLPGSPGETYLQTRGVSIDVARSLRLGWSTSGQLRDRVVFPITNRGGIATSATGRAVDDHARIKYKALKADDGYVRTYFNGAAIGRVAAARGRLIIVEGPMDAAACIAGGIDNVVATMGVNITRPEDFRGVGSILIAYDGDDTGQKRRRELMGALLAEGVDVVALSAGTLGDCKDLAEYWQRHHALPAPLVAWAIAAPLPPSSPDVGKANTKDDPKPIDSTLGVMTDVDRYRRRLYPYDLIPLGGWSQDQLDWMVPAGAQAVQATNMSTDDLTDDDRQYGEQAVDDLIREG